MTRLYGNKRIWITEYGYQTNPPDRIFGVSLANQAKYLTQAYGIAKRNPRIDMFLWFLLRDERRLVERRLAVRPAHRDAAPRSPRSPRSRSCADNVRSMSGLDWPGEERRRPPMSSPTWAVRAPLAAWLEEQAAQGRAGYRVLDVGCGPKPYYPFFAERASEYVGVDVVENPAAELRGSVEALPVEDASFDLVLCTQVLEHCDDPAQAVRELRRVTAPGGRVLASTHGVQVYHPSPEDYWRWTHAGLRRLFDGERELAVGRRSRRRGHGDVPRDAARHVHRDRVPPRRACRGSRGGPVWLLNRAAGALDRRVELLREPRPGSLTANFHVVATVGA